jgi:hypothetical protein
MADQQIINVGASPNDGDGDSLRNAFIKTNTNFTTLFGVAGVTGIASGTSNLSIPVANGNVTISATGVPNVVVVGPLGATVTGNLNVTNTANIGNIVVPGTIVATGTIQGIGDITGVAITASGNLTSGAYIFGDGGYLSNVTSVTSGATQIGNSTTIMAVTGASGNITTQVNGVANILTLTTTSVTTSKLISATGNVTAGNLITAGQVSATGNVTGGNINSNRLYGTSLNITSVGGLTLAPSGNIVMSNTIINGVAYPLQDNDAANKLYVDNVAQGLHTHDSCNAATTTTLATISGGTVTYNNGTSGVGATLTTTGSYTTIDGVTLSNGMRILVKNEATAANNGIYDRTSATVLTRSDDFDTTAEMAGGDFTFVTAGTLYDNTGWVMTDAVTTVGTTAVNWAQFSGAGTYTAGSGLTLTGSSFSVNVDNITTAISAGNVVVKASANLTTPNIGAATGTSLSVSGNITSGNLITSGTTINSSISTTGNIIGGNISATNHTGTTVSVTGNITGNYILGNGSALTGVTASGVAASALTGTTLSSNVTSSSLTSVGTLASLIVTGNISGGNVGATAHTGSIVTVSGNITGGNILTAGIVSAAGNVTGNYILGNGALLTGVITSVANINSGTSNVTVVSSGGNVSVGVGGTSNVAVFASTGEYVTGVISASGNITGGNIVTEGTTGILSVNSITHTGTNAVGNIGSSSSYFNQVFATATTALYADVAELYVADAQYAPGTVLEFGGANEVTIAEDSTIRIAGVVSTDPAYLMNAGQDGEYIVPVALLGRVPCRVRGNIRKGDMLISGGDGVARSAQAQPMVGSVIGKALENHAGGDGVITVVVGRI